MRVIDADELIEHLLREDVSSREKIVEIVDNRPTVNFEDGVRRELQRIAQGIKKILNENHSEEMLDARI